MLKAAVLSNNSIYPEIISRYKNLFEFVPLIRISEGRNKLIINNLLPNINIDNTNYLGIVEILSDFDLIIVSDNVSDKMDEILQSISVNKIYMKDSKLATNYMTGNLLEFSMKFQKKMDVSLYCDFVFTILSKLRSCGYNINVTTDHDLCNEILSLVKNYDNPDFTIIFSDYSNNGKTTEVNNFNFSNELENALEYTKNYARNIVNKETYLKRDLQIYNEQDKKNIFVFDIDNQPYLFKSCDRSFVSLYPDLENIIKYYNGNDLSKLSAEVGMILLENFNQLRDWERQKEREFSTLMKSKYMSIQNINDVILSYLGDRKCNLACKYCFSDHCKEEKSALAREKITEIADYIINGNENIKLHIDNYIGGEPTANFSAVQDMHHIISSYQKISDLYISFGCLTNGTNITDSQLEWLKYNNPYVGFSIDGDKKTNDNIRVDKNGNGTYDRIVNTIKRLEEHDWPTETGISCVITSNNVNIKELFLHFIDDLDIHNIVIKPVRAPEYSSYALTMKNIDMLKEGYKELFDFIFEAAAQGDTSYLKSMLMPLDYAGRFFIRTYLGDRVIVKRCGASEHIFSVGNDACIYPCDSFNGEESMKIADFEKNVFYNNFKVPFVAQVDSKFGCKNCWARYLCGGICQYVQHVNNYEANSVTQQECELAKFLIQEAIKFWIKADNIFSDITKKEIEEHIYRIGFTRCRSKYSFFYAPC